MEWTIDNNVAPRDTPRGWLRYDTAQTTYGTIAGAAKKRGYTLQQADELEHLKNLGARGMYPNIWVDPGAYSRFLSYEIPNNWADMTGGTTATPTDPNSGGGNTGGGNTGGTTPPNRNGDYQGFGSLWMASGGRTPQDLANFITAHPEFGAQLYGSKQDKVQIGGRIFDAVISAGLGGRGASWYDVTNGGGGDGGGGTKPPPGTGGTNPNIPGIPNNAPGDQFNDPYTQYYEQLLKARMAELARPVEDPSRTAMSKFLDVYAQMLSGQLAQQQSANTQLQQRRAAVQPATDQLVGYLKDRSTTLQDPNDPWLQELQKRATTLDQPDPWWQELQTWATSLQDPNDPWLQELQKRATSLDQPDPRWQELQTWATSLEDPNDPWLQELQKRATTLDQPDPRWQELQTWATSLEDPNDPWLTGLQQWTTTLEDPNDPWLLELQKRAAKLDEPVYTGTEQEILRTQLLDPIERDRQASRQRALENVSSRGMDLSSGIAQELLNKVDTGYDRSRATAQGDLAYRTIEEQRAREQQAHDVRGVLSTETLGRQQVAQNVRGLISQEQINRQQLAQGVRGFVSAEQQGREQQAHDVRGTFAAEERNRQQVAQNVRGFVSAEQQGRQQQAHDVRGTLAAEERNREQESQQLLALIPQAIDAAARGDLDFLQSLTKALDSLASQRASVAAQSASLGQNVRDEEQARRNEMIGWAAQLYELPMNAAQLGMAALGQAPNPASMTNSAIQFAQLRNQQQAQNAGFWFNLAQSFSPLFR